jgi:hypothetical protein
MIILRRARILNHSVWSVGLTEIQQESSQQRKAQSPTICHAMLRLHLRYIHVWNTSVSAAFPEDDVVLAMHWALPDARVLFVGPQICESTSAPTVSSFVSVARPPHLAQICPGAEFSLHKSAACCGKQLSWYALACA